MTDIYCGPIVAFEFADMGTLIVHRCCPTCGRFVSNVTATASEIHATAHAICSKCGPVEPEIEGWL